MNLQKLTKRIVSCALAGAILAAVPVHAGVRSFPDVHRSAWYYGPVMNLTASGVVSGYTDGHFRPEQNATAGEALKLTLTAAGVAVRPVTSGHWAVGYLDHAVTNGLISPDVIDHPDQSITRGTVAQLLVRTLGLSVTTAASPFADTHDPHVVTLYQAGLISGEFQNGQRVYRPDAPISRGELCAIIDRMNGQDQIQYGSYLVDVAKNLPRNPYTPGDFRLSDGWMTCQRREAVLGIDVSYYQEDIDWRAVKRSGVQFVMIRLGYRGYESGKLMLDKRFYEYIAGATAAGLDVGIYFFSQAITVQEAREEAEFVLSHLGQYAVTYPVVFDWEIIGVRPARTDDLDPQTLTAAARTFCDTIAAAGYTPMIYFTKYMGYISYDISQLGAYDFWFAEYGAHPSFYYDFQMWQYSDSGTVPGIRGPVDLNLCFKPYA